ncbi:MAG TPA: TadE/TadG family type IV pilus assembly protein [Rhizomicrobium sp.]
MAFLAGCQGAAAAEFALVLSLLVIPVLNIVDLGIYSYQRMELDNAGQVAAKAAWSIVPSCTLPVTVGSNCPTLNGAINTALHSTPLGSSVTYSKSESYYCVSSSTSQLVSVASPPSSPPSTCTSVGSPNAAPGDYILIAVSYTYRPVFTGISVVSLLASPITSTVWMRLN